MAIALACPVEDLLGPLPDELLGTEKGNGIEVALDRFVLAHALPGSVQVAAPVKPDNVSARLGNHLEQMSRPVGKMDQGHGLLHAGNHVLLVRQHEFAVVRGSERPDPGVEELHHLHAGIDLGIQVIDDNAGQVLHELVPGLRLREHHGLGMLVVPGPAALDHVAGKRERRAREPDERHLAVKLLEHNLNRLHEIIDLGGRIDLLELLHIGHRSDRIMDNRPLALGEFQADAHWFERQQDVGEDDCRVDLIPPDRLDRDFRSHFRGLAHLQEGILGPDLAVFRQVPACLAHHPHGGAIYRLAPASLDKPVCSRHRAISSISC